MSLRKMLDKLLKNIKFRSEVKNFFSQNKEKLIDIILFGSITRGKEEPKDIDIFILYKDKVDLNLDHILKKKLEKLNIQITSKSYKELFESSFKAREAILSEGYSLILNKKISKGFGFINFVLFRYELKGKNKSERMRFYYSLYGRGKEKGILDKLKGLKFSGSTIFCPIESAEEMKEFFQNWNINYTNFPTLIPERIVISKALSSK